MCILFTCATFVPVKLFAIQSKNLVLQCTTGEVIIITDDLELNFIKSSCKFIIIPSNMVNNNTSSSQNLTITVTHATPLYRGHVEHSSKVHIHPVKKPCWNDEVCVDVQFHCKFILDDVNVHTGILTGISSELIVTSAIITWPLTL